MDTVVCYNFYGECLTKYSNRAARESEICESTRNETLKGILVDFNGVLGELLRSIEIVKNNIDCGSKNETEQKLCLNNIVSF